MLVVNIYCQFSHPTEMFVMRLENILNAFNNKDILIVGDLNAKSPLWHCPGSDGNGEMFEELIQQFNLNIHNREGQPPTFRGRAKAESNIDVTMSRGNMYTDLTD